MYIGVLPAKIAVHCVYAWFPQSLKETTRHPGTGATISCMLSCAC